MPAHQIAEGLEKGDIAAVILQFVDEVDPMMDRRTFVGAVATSLR